MASLLTKRTFSSKTNVVGNSKAIVKTPQRNLSMKEMKSRACIYGPSAVYAIQALTFAQKKNQVEQALKEVKSALGSFTAENKPALKMAQQGLKSLGRVKRTDVIKSIIDDPKLGEYVKFFVASAGYDQNFALIPRAMTDFVKLAEASQGKIEGTVTFAEEMPTSIKDKMVATVQRVYLQPSDKLTLNFKVDPSLIGGFTLQTSTFVVDRSWSKVLIKAQEAFRTVAPKVLIPRFEQTQASVQARQRIG